MPCLAVRKHPNHSICNSNQPLWVRLKSTYITQVLLSTAATRCGKYNRISRHSNKQQVVGTSCPTLPALADHCCESTTSSLMQLAAEAASAVRRSHTTQHSGRVPQQGDDWGGGWTSVKTSEGANQDTPHHSSQPWPCKRWSLFLKT